MLYSKSHLKIQYKIAQEPSYLQISHYSHFGNSDLLKDWIKQINKKVPFQNYQWMLDVIRSIKQIFTLWIFCWWLPVWLLICLERYRHSCWNFFLRKHRLFLGINTTDHIFCSSLQSKYIPCPHWAPLPWPLCSSLQKKKEDSQRCQLGHGVSSSCQVGVNDTDKKEILAMKQALVRSMATTFFFVLLTMEMSVVYMMGWGTELFTISIGQKCNRLARCSGRAVSEVHLKLNSNPRWSLRWIWEIQIGEWFCVSMKQVKRTTSLR